MSSEQRKRQPSAVSMMLGLGGHHRIDPDILRTRMQERDARTASDTRTEAQRWLGDPPPMQSAMAQGSQPAPRRIAGQRVDLWKFKPR
jgi:hypothetical protein